ncbi:Uncharacterized protein DBV15_03647 [Temnothorax longispinosus]|uniref:Uncharacterized protein n=1 Tax=Temnothorax longispinosus TaxID=300112 RepID=A0A4S2KAN8_9HYME|nr:Uncharacterized protein DBV15_03647 [Temnothorax longispinosus]
MFYRRALSGSWRLYAANLARRGRASAAGGDGGVTRGPRRGWSCVGRGDTGARMARRSGVARHGTAWRGAARRRAARHGKAKRGETGRGEARRSEARARFGSAQRGAARRSGGGSVGRLACLLTRALACGYVRSSPIPVFLLSQSAEPTPERSDGGETYEKKEDGNTTETPRRRSSSRGAKAAEKGETILKNRRTRGARQKDGERQQPPNLAAPRRGSEPADRPTDRPGSSQPSSRPGHYDCQANANGLCIINGPRATAGRGSHGTQSRIYSPSPRPPGRSATRIFIIFHWVFAKRAHRRRPLFASWHRNLHSRGIRSNCSIDRLRSQLL